MKRFLFIVKVLFSTLFVVGILMIVFLLFLYPKDKRFSTAEHSQGSYLSQTVFDILTFQYPDYSDAYFERSVVFNKRGDYAKGFESLDKAVELDPTLHLGYRGWLKLHKLKDYKGCIDDLIRLDSLTPNFVDAPWGDDIHYLLGLSYSGLKKYDLAILEFDKTLKTSKDSSWVNPYLFLHKGIIYYNTENYQEALNNFNAYIKNNYNTLTPESCYWKAKTFKKLRKIDSAKVLLRKSKELYSQGLKVKDNYNEVQNELYLSDIEKYLKILEVSK